MLKKILPLAGVTVGLLGCFIMFAGWSDNNEKTPVLLTDRELQWGLGPDAFPLGVRAAIVDGEPDLAGPYTMRLRLPANYKITAHWMVGEQHITVLSGSVALALGPRFDAKQLKVYPAGSYLVIPARARYFLKTAKSATLEVHGQGPWEVNYVDASEDPRNVSTAAL